ncbi:MAG TPA: hypothetical protein VFB04_00995 [Terriglobales bacterium]|nr:hypothetical protein [Terriglobales bacterium]
MTDEEIVKAVRLRYRICNYLFRLGIAWFVVGVILEMLRLQTQWPPITIEMIGAGIFTTGAAMTFALYRCPVCDHYLNKFRPDKEKCAHCGAKVR